MVEETKRYAAQTLSADTANQPNNNNNNNNNNTALVKGALYLETIQRRRSRRILRRPNREGLPGLAHTCSLPMLIRLIRLINHS